MCESATPSEGVGGAERYRYIPFIRKNTTKAVYVRRIITLHFSYITTI